MAFVNINLREQKLEQYDFSILEKITRSESPSDALTLDAERNIWLRYMYRRIEGDPREEICKTIGDIWGFYWKGTFFALETFKSNTQGNGRGEHLSYHAKVRVLTTTETLGNKTFVQFQRHSDEEKAQLFPFPKALEPQKLEILKDLKTALEAYAGGGSVVSESSGCTVELEFQGVTL
jgi:hypothetical protein